MAAKKPAKAAAKASVKQTKSNQKPVAKPVAKAANKSTVKPAAKPSPVKTVASKPAKAVPQKEVKKDSKAVAPKIEEKEIAQTVTAAPAKKMSKLGKGSKEKQENKPTVEQGLTTGQKGNLEKIIKKLISKGKERGAITYDELNNALPAEEFSSDQIEDAMSTLSDAGVQLVDGDDESGDEPQEKPQSDDEEYESGGNISDDDTGRTDDPVRMYLREMGTVELLSREGEIAIAKRIEAGRETMIGGICESPLAIESIIAWAEALQKGDILLREVIDLEATYGGDSPAFGDAVPKAADLVEAPEKPEAEVAEGGEVGADDMDENALSLAAMEAELAPKVYPIFDNIKKTYKKLQKYQQEKITTGKV